MPLGTYVIRAAERWRKEEEERQRAARIKLQAATFRTVATVGRQFHALTGLRASTVAPQGADYVREQQQDKSIRPSWWARHRPPPAPVARPTPPPVATPPPTFPSPAAPQPQGRVQAPPGFLASITGQLGETLAQRRRQIELQQLAQGFGGGGQAEQFFQGVQGAPRSDISQLIGLEQTATGRDFTPPELLQQLGTASPFEQAGIQNELTQRTGQALNELVPSTRGDTIANSVINPVLEGLRFSEEEVGNRIAGAVRAHVESTFPGSEQLFSRLPFIQEESVRSAAEREGLLGGLKAGGADVPFAGIVADPLNLVGVEGLAALRVGRGLLQGGRFARRADTALDVADVVRRVPKVADELLGPRSRLANQALETQGQKSRFAAQEAGLLEPEPLAAGATARGAPLETQAARRPVSAALEDVRTGQPFTQRLFRGEPRGGTRPAEQVGEYFTGDPEVAGVFATSPGRTVRKELVQLNNPLVVDDAAEATRVLTGRRVATDEFDEVMIANAARRQGYDGIIYRRGANSFDDLGIEVVKLDVSTRPRTLAARPAADVPVGVPARAGQRSPTEAVPEVGGGAGLSEERLAARRAAQEPPDAAREAISPTNPPRETRELWRLYEGAKAKARLQRNTWVTDRYEQAKRAGIDIRKRSVDQPDATVDILEGGFGGGRQRAPIGGFRENQREFVGELYDLIDEKSARIAAADPDFAPNLMDEYFPHMFKHSPKGVRGGKGLKLAPGFKKQRKLEGPLAEILERRDDLDLVTWDPVEYVALFDAEVEQYIASLEVIRGLRAKGLMVPKDAARSATWRQPDVAAFKVKSQLEGWVAEPKVATMLEQMFGRSLFETFGPLKAVKTVRDVSFRAKVFGGAFQLIDFTHRDLGLGLSQLAPIRRVGGKGVNLPGGFRAVMPNVKGALHAWSNPLTAIARGLVPAIDRRATRLAGKNPDLVLGYGNGLGAGVDPSFAETAIGKFPQIVPQTIRGKQIPGARGLQDILDFVGGGIYEGFHKQTLEQGYLIEFRRNLMQSGMSRDEAARLAVEKTNVFFSSVPNWQGAIKGATGRDFIKIPLFAPGEIEGMLRMPFQSPTELAGIIGMTAIMAEMLNKLWTGEWLDPSQLVPYTLEPDELDELRKDPRAIKDVGIPGVTFNVRLFRPRLPWDGPDGRPQYLDLLGQMDTVVRLALDPVFGTQTRLGQFISVPYAISRVLEGKAPPFGEEVDSLGDITKFAIQQGGPIAGQPFISQEQERIGTRGSILQGVGFNISSGTRRELQTSAIADHLEEFVGDYSDLPGERPTNYGQLDPQDKVIMDEANPDLFGESFDTSRGERLEDVDERVHRDFRNAATDQANATADSELDDLRSDVQAGGLGDILEQESRRNARTDLQNSLRRRTGAIDNARTLFEDQFPPEDREDFTPVQRTLSSFFDWLDGNPSPRSGDEEGWARREASFDQQFSAADQRTINQELSVNDHAVEVAYHDLLSTIGDSGYYDEEEGSDRENFRRSNREVDAALFALGYTSVLRTGSRFREAQGFAAELLRDLYGIDVDARDIPGATGGGGRGRRSRGSRGSR